MPRPKGLAKTGGRIKDSKNKAPELRALISEALDRAGGVAYLERQAHENPGPFLSLLGRLLPREMHAEISGELTVRAEVRRELIDRLCVLMVRPGTHQEHAAAVLSSEEGTAAALPDMRPQVAPGTLEHGEHEPAQASRQEQTPRQRSTSSLS